MESEKHSNFGARRVISFYLPLERPMAIPAPHGLVNPRPEDVPWLPCVTLPKPFDGPLFQSGKNFVAFNPYSAAGNRVISAKPISLSRMAADAVAQGFGPGSSMEWPEDFDAGFGLQYSNLRMTTVLIGNGFETNDMSISEALSRCFESLRPFEVAYSIVSRDIAYPFTTVTSAASSCFFNIFDVASDQWSESQLIMINMTDGFRLVPPALLAPETIEEIAQRTYLARVGFPLSASEYWYREAERSLYLSGSTEMSSLQAFTAGEIYLDSILMMLGWEHIAYSPNRENLSEEQIASWYSFKNTHGWRINSKFREWLHGWDSGPSPRVPERWLEVAADVRSQVVHTGYMPSFDEAESVLVCYTEIVEFVKQLLASDRNRTRYPRTTGMVLSESGLRRLSVYSGAVKRLLESENRNSWVEEFLAFQQKVRSSISSPPRRKRESD